MTDANTWHREVLLRTLAYPEITPEARARNLAKLAELKTQITPETWAERYTVHHPQNRCTIMRTIKGKQTRCCLEADHESECF